jgi:hypothetical protein
VTGSTSAGDEARSTSFPTTPGAFQTTPGGGLVFMIDPPAGGGSTAPAAPDAVPALPSASAGSFFASLPAAFWGDAGMLDDLAKVRRRAEPL